MNLFHYLSSVVQRYPQKEALVYRERRLTYSRLRERICKLADALSHLGIGAGDKVGLICRNSDAYVEIFFAAAKLGAVSEHFNWRLHTDVLAQQVALSDAKVIFVSEKVYRRCEGLKRNLNRDVRCIVVEDSDFDEIHYASLFEDDYPESPTVNRAADDPCIILYTGGTTGTGKAVVHSVSGFLIHTLVVISALGWNQDTVLLCTQPLFHAASTGVYSTLLAGGRVVVEDKFDPGHCLALVERERVTQVGLVPHVIEWLLQEPELERYDLSSLQNIIYSGAPMAPEILLKAYRILDCGFTQIYGMTELGPNVAVLLPDEHLVFLENSDACRLPVGKPILGTQVRIQDEDRPCARGEIGEILVCSDTLMLCYQNQPELTEQVISDGWYRTGDNGYLDEEGYLYLVGRKQHMIICGGENIYPQEVEQAVHSIGDAVQDVAVIGVPNLRWGEVVKALIVKAPGANLTAEEVLNHCRKSLSAYKKPRIIQFVSDLPRNDSGKLDRKLVLERYENEDGWVDRDFLHANCSKEAF